MSCGCSNNINYPSGCGNSSCTSCSATSCEQVVYTGPNLVCSGINNDDNLCVALQKLDNTLCNPPGLTVTASNGLYKNLLLNDIRMGGPLTEVTTIGTSNTNTLSITGLATDASPLYVLVQTNLGVVRKSLVSTITASILALLTADNGLTYTSTNVQLGGPLIKPTTVTAGSTNTLAIAGLVSDPSATYVVSVNNSTGVLTKTALSAIIPIVPTITANNGLTKTVNNIQLGGPLVQDTTVDLATYKLTLKDSGAAPTGLEIIPGAAAPTNWTTSNVNIFSGKVYSDNLVWVDDNNVGIGIKPDDSTTNPSAPRLYVYKALSNGTTGGNFATSSVFIMGGSVTTLSSGNKYVSSYSKLEFRPGANITVSGAIDKFVSTSLSEFIFEPSGAAGDTISNGKISAIAARGYFVYDKNLDSFATIRIAPSVRDGGNGYTGTIDELIGLKIENQRDDSNLSNQITKTYGIRQLGLIDYNYFAANTGIGQQPEPETDPIVTSNSKLSVYRGTGFSNNPIAVAVNTTLNMSGNLGSGGTSVYAGNFGNLQWAPTTNTIVATQGSIAGNSSYLSLTSANATTGGYLSSTAAQIYTASALQTFITGVSSSGATITVPNTTDMTKIVVGYQVILKAGGGNLGYVNTYVETVSPGTFSFTIKRISGGTRGAWTYSSVTPSVPLSAASIVVAKASSGDDLGSVDIAIGARILTPVADRYAGSSVRIDSAVGLQIDDQLAFIPSPFDPWAPAIDLTPGYISESYAIKQVGVNDINQFNAIVNMFPNLPVYANNAAALAGGLAVDTVYRTATGELRIVI